MDLCFHFSWVHKWSPPSPVVLLSVISVNCSQLWSQKGMILLLVYCQKVNSNPTLHHSNYVMHLPSSPHVGIYHYIITGRKVSKILGERDHIHVTFITVYCYNCPIYYQFLLLLCLIYKIKLYHRYICIGKPVYTRFGTPRGFRHPLGVLEYPHE